VSGDRRRQHTPHFVLRARLDVQVDLASQEDLETLPRPEAGMNMNVNGVSVLPTSKFPATTASARHVVEGSRRVRTLTKLGGEGVPMYAAVVGKVILVECFLGHDASMPTSGVS